MKTTSVDRKAKRKEKRKNKKSEKFSAYKSHNSSRNGSESSNNDKHSKKINSIKKQISSSKDEMKARHSNSEAGSLNKKKKVEVVKSSSGLNFGSSNLNTRMAALQEFIGKETKGSGGTGTNQNATAEKKRKPEKSENDNKKKGKKKKKNTIKDKRKLEELEKGIEKDSRELNDIYRQLRFNAQQKKSKSLLRNMFGGDIGDIFDALDVEPTEVDLLSDQAAMQPKLHTSKRKTVLEIPKNARFISTKQDYFEQDDIPKQIGDEEVESTKQVKRTKKRKASDQLRSDDEETNNCKQRKLSSKKKAIPIVYEFEEETLSPIRSKKSKIKVLQLTPSTELKSIISNKKKKKRKRNARLSVSFNLDNNDVRLIPTIEMVSGFKIVDNDSSDEEKTVDPLVNSNGFCEVSDTHEDNYCSMTSGTEESEDDIHMEADFTDSEESSQEDSDCEENGYEDSDCEDEDHCGEDDEYAGFSESDDDINMVAEFSDSDGSVSDQKEDETNKSSANRPKSKVKKSNSNNRNTQAGDLTEDIYGRLRDSKGNIVSEGKHDEASSSGSGNDTGGGSGYSTPASRKQDSQLQELLNSDAIKRVRTQLRGRLNRLAEVNMAGTVAMVTGLYSEHPRQLLNIVLSELLLAELVTGDGVTLDRHCQECAVLVVAVAANVAEEIGAHIVADLMVSWHKELQDPKTSSHLLRNYVMFVAHLYNFGLVHAVLIFDVIKILLDNFTSSNVEQLIQLVGSVGFLLRKDDPNLLKDVIVRVQLASTADGTAAGPQLELLNAMLRAIKNNNESKMPNYDPSYTKQLHKLLRAFIGGDGKMSPVRVTLEDLLLSETRGRWWVVGSAWTGASMLNNNTPATAADASAALTDKKNSKPLSSGDKSNFSASFLKLAENMRITRPPKINILFALTVGSEDKAEAFSKLLDLSLAPAQEKLIFDIMLFCIQKMKTYKPFYSLLAIQLCGHDLKYSRLLQHALWDKFSDFDALKPRELKLLAKFIIDIVKADSLNLSLLKTLPFAEANIKITTFLEDVFCQLFDAKEGCHVSINAFQKLFKSKKLQQLRMQFKLFLTVFVVPKLKSGKLVPDNCLFGKRMYAVLDMLGSDQGALL